MLGILFLSRGIFAYQANQAWATSGGTRGGPLTPGMACFIGGIIIIGATYYAYVSIKAQMAKNESHAKDPHGTD